MAQIKWAALQVCEKGSHLTFPTFKKTFRAISAKSIFRYVIYVTPKKLHAKKE